MKRISSFIPFLVVGLILVFVVLVITLIIIAASAGVGWLVQRVLPFSLYESTLLALIVITVMLALFFVGRPSSFGGDDDMSEEDGFLFRSPGFPEDDYIFDDDEDEEYEEDDGDDSELVIPMSRFWPESQRPTWEKWLTFVLANDIYDDLAVNDQALNRWMDEELQEVAIDLAEAAIIGCKRLAPNKTPHLSKTKLREALKKKKRTLEYTPFLGIMLPIVNENLNLWGDVIVAVKSENRWRKKVDEVLMT